jgi:hypothetical protein
VSEIGLVAATKKSIDEAMNKTKSTVEDAIKQKILEAHERYVRNSLFFSIDSFHLLQLNCFL